MGKKRDPGVRGRLGEFEVWRPQEIRKKLPDRAGKARRLEPDRRWEGVGRRKWTVLE